MSTLRLGVNVDHVATLRQVRGTTYPSPLEAALQCARAGADGITIHLREDRRHIQDADVFAIRRALDLPLNLELADTPEMVQIAVRARPAEVCLVPERRRELTTEGGLDVVRKRRSLARTIHSLQKAGIRVSLFVEPDPAQLIVAAELGAECVELHTGTFCSRTGRAAARELKRLIEGAHHAHQIGLQVNAGHGIHLENLSSILEVPHLDTLNIGHSIIARAVFTGLGAAVREMRRAMRSYRGGRP